MFLIWITDDADKSDRGEVDDDNIDDDNHNYIADVQIWNLDDGSCVGILQGHRDAVTCLTIDSSEVRIITGSLDR